MKITHTLGAAIVMATGAAALAGQPVNLQPSEYAGGFSGVTNVELPELIGSEYYDFYQDFSISGDAGELYSAVLMTRVVRSDMTGMLHFNYMIMDADESLAGAVSNIDISGFAGYQTRVEYRNGAAAATYAAPIDANRDASGDVLSFDFGDSFDTGEQSKFFFVMLNTDTFEAPTEGVSGNGATATIYLRTGESVTIDVVGAGPVPAPGALALLGLGGLMGVRRRR